VKAAPCRLPAEAACARGGAPTSRGPHGGDR
jgi:hypothetical protein